MAKKQSLEQLLTMKLEESKALAKYKNHEQTVLLLPWYVNNTLKGRDAELVLRHLGECVDCQEERDRLYELQQIVREGDAGTAGTDASLKKVLRRIELSERDKASVREYPAGQQRNRSISFGFRGIAIAASVLAFLVGGAALLQPNRPVAEYQTLSTEPVDSGVRGLDGAGTIERLELGFQTPIPAITLRRVLIETGSNIVSGPDEKGSYIVELEVPAHTSADEFLDQLQQIDGVEYASFTNR